MMTVHDIGDMIVMNDRITRVASISDYLLAMYDSKNLADNKEKAIESHQR